MGSAFAATHYVDINTTNAVAPYTNWWTAAASIQDAISEATDGDTVLVTNGLYDTGGVVIYGAMTNRIAITNAITVESVNGAEVTIVKGQEAAGGGNGNEAVRCAYVGTNAVLSGFTLTSGHTRTGGDDDYEKRGGGAWCETNGVVSNCTVVGNGAGHYGGGTRGGILHACTIVGNSAAGGSGGAHGGILNNCMILSNSAPYGGGAMGGTHYNGLLAGNSAAGNGGGVWGGTLHNCTLLGNSTEGSGGGAYDATLYNCIVYYNSAAGDDANIHDGTATYTCTAPAKSGTGNFTNAPGILGLGNPHVVSNSPCVNQGLDDGWMATATDLDGEPRLNGTVDVGCDEFHADGMTGSLTVASSASRTTFVTNIPVQFTADIQGMAGGYEWIWGDGESTSNQLIAFHAYTATGDYSVVLRAWNGDVTASSTVVVHVVATIVHYAAPGGGHIPPFTNWVTAATNLQDAINVSDDGESVLVSNGVYDAGGKVIQDVLTNRIAITNRVVVESVNGPEVTAIVGQGPFGDAAVRCAYVGSNAVLVGFTLTNGYTRTSGVREEERSGGGAWCEPGGVVSNCIIAGNFAEYYGAGVYEGECHNCTISGNTVDGQGGGSAGGTLCNCTLSGNWAIIGGGGQGSTLYNCTLIGNTAWKDGGGFRAGILHNCVIVGNTACGEGGGTWGGTLYNCVVYYNTARAHENTYEGTATYTCTTPLPDAGEGNFTNAPGITCLDGPHLVSNSPCINQGTNLEWMATATDMDGEPRLNGIVDVGCDEYYAAALTGALTVAISVEHTTVVTNVLLRFLTDIEGWAGGYAWDMADGEVLTNHPVVWHAYSMTGDYPVVLCAWNDDTSASATVMVHVVAARTRYVSPSGGHTAPFTNWASAATNIQPAIDEAVPGDTVLVTNGVYSVGGVPVYGPITNRIAITKLLTVCSVNGREATVIQGQGPVGDSAVRCAYIASGATLAGITLTGGCTRAGGGCYGERCGGGAWCEVGGMLSNCVLAGDSAQTDGGGAWGGTLCDCTLSGNSGHNGGGASYGALYGCTVTGNTADVFGGGVYESTLYGCTVAGNAAHCGGGVSYGTLYSCQVVNNRAIGEGEGGGVRYCTAYNCTILNNSAVNEGGGAWDSTLWNCTVYYNAAAVDNNIYKGTAGYTCTTPLPASGFGNFTNPPGVLSLGNPHIVSNAPCVNRGTNQAWMAAATDIDGEPRLNGTVDVGCDEFHAGSLTGALTAAFSVNFITAVTNTPLLFTADILGRAGGYAWAWGDGTETTNCPYGFHDYSTTGDYAVVLRAWNNDGLASVTVTVHIVASTTRHVSPCGGHTAPFTNWVTAATNIQSAIDEALAGDLVLVTNGVYDTGETVIHGAMANRIAITKPLRVCSVNGPASTFIAGEGPLGNDAVRCAYVTNGAVLVGFTLSNGYTRSSLSLDEWTQKSGGGAWCEDGGMLSNCVISGCTARYGGGGAYKGMLYDCTLSSNWATLGGGTYEATLNGCTLSSNVADNYGGGAYEATLYNCMLVGNTASRGGGAHRGTFYNCTFRGNSANNSAGAYASELYNCTICSNTAANSGGGVGGSGKLRNCIVYYNTASTNENMAAGSATYTCTTPEESGTGNFTNAPRFVDAGAGDYRLLSSSPCINTGANEAWMEDAVDPDGHPRIFDGTVDVGAYEYVIRTAIKAWLEGPYDTNTGVMTTHLGDGGGIPLVSPYAADVQAVECIPTNVTDWVLVQLLEEDFAVRAARSGFLRNDGTFVNLAGETGSVIDATIGAPHFIVLKHRNHIAVMSAGAMEYTNSVVSYDFTTGAGASRGGTNAVIELEPGAWGMIAGDADGDGEVTVTDREIVEKQEERTGYLAGDLNLDNVVTNDVELCTNNMGKVTGATNGAVAITPQLSVSPPRKTLLGGSTLNFSVSGCASGTWFLVKNPSGGTLSYVNPTSVLYEAGTTSSCVDVIQAWDGTNGFGRAYANIISASDVAQAGKAVVLAGRKGEGDPLWPNTDYLADKAYNVLAYRGYAEDNIQYVSPVTNQDVDGDGACDDVDLLATFDNVELTFTNWVGNANKLFVYMVDHGVDSGGYGYFRLNSAELLPATNLCAWLDDIQNTYTTEVTVVIDCCYAGSLIDELGYTGVAKRVLIGSAGTNEPAYFVAGGLVSFSDAFFSGILLGYDVADAYDLAAGAMSTYQTSVYDDNGDGTMASNLYLGATFVAGKDMPVIGSVCGNQLLDGTTLATLWADDVVAAYEIQRVWCTIVPPGYVVTNADDPVSDLPDVTLPYSNQVARYQGRHDGFSEEGAYKVVYYAEDVWGSVSLPSQSYVIQSGFDERAILLAGGPTNSAYWTNADLIAQSAYHTFRSRWFEHDKIYYLCADTNRDVEADGTNDVDALPTLDELSYAITNWAASADRLTVYLVGEGTGSTFRVNETQYLSAASLDLWLDQFQVSNAAANVVLEFSESGAFVPSVPHASNRVTMACTRSGQPAVWASDGLVSFSHFFLTRVFEGESVGDAFTDARRKIRLATGRARQTAELDDDGDGVANEKYVDGKVAATRYIGPAFVMGEDGPVIGEVIPNTLLAGSHSLTLWAADVTDMDGISNVWCVITPPDYGGTGDLPETNLAWNAGAGRYEALYTNFTQPCSYVCTFYASDSNGDLSTPVQSEMVSADAYEPDNTNTQAHVFNISDTEVHNFHDSNAVDWVMFVADTNFVYQIETIQQGTNVDTVLDVYYAPFWGALTNIYPAEDEMGKGIGDGEMVNLDFHEQSGLYYVRVSSADPDGWGPDSAYDLSIWVPEGDADLWVFVGSALDPANAPPSTEAVVDGAVTQVFSTGNAVKFTMLSAGIHTVQVTTAAGYYLLEDPAAPNQSTNMNSNMYGNPRRIGITNEFRVAPFYYAPYARAEGVLRDARTRERLEGAQIRFYTSNDMMGVTVYTGCPWGATYESKWYSVADGSFPTNVWLPAVDWDLRVTLAGYTDTLFEAIITNVTEGTVTNLGELLVAPTDLNGNGIADAWEDAYFGAGSNVVAGEDTDNDGFDNGTEYKLGTHPKNAGSNLRVEDGSAYGAGGFTLDWPVVEDRTYRVRGCDNLLTGSWDSLYGPQEASAGQTNMQWTDSDATNAAVRSYRIDALVP